MIKEVIIADAIAKLNDYVEQNSNGTFYFKYDIETLSKMLELDLELIQERFYSKKRRGDIFADY